jgi:hypothetical protein
LNAFTRWDLAAVVASLSLLVITLVPAPAASRTRSQGVRCLDNLRQIMSAMSMYTHDNHDFFPPNPDDGNSLLGYNWCIGLAGPGGSRQFDSDVMTDPRKCLLVPYTGSNTSLFRCTADGRTGLYTGTNPALFGKTVSATRTIAMNGAVGTVDPGFAQVGAGHSGVPTLPACGPWLSGTYSGCNLNNVWRTYGKYSDMVMPAPANLWVFGEEDPYSLNDGSLQMPAVGFVWVDLPATLHNMAGVIAFGDGHTELHKWVSTLTKVTGPFTGQPPVPANDPDWNWMAARTTSPK